MPLPWLLPGCRNWKPDCYSLRLKPQGSCQVVGKEQAEQQWGGSEGSRDTIQYARSTLYIQVLAQSQGPSSSGVNLRFYCMLRAHLGVNKRFYRILRNITLTDHVIIFHLHICFVRKDELTNQPINYPK